MKIACENPVIIVHPSAGELIARYGNYTIDGVLFNVPRNKRNLYEFDPKEVSVSLNNISEDMLDSCFIANPNTGKTYPLYLQVPCGHCGCCMSSKVASFVQRCELETMAYGSHPLFITLTYNEENYPKTGVSVRDVQLFLKRFRIGLQRAGYRQKIRYVCVSEYGRRTHRGHYHMLAWNLHQTDILDYRQIRELLAKNWNKGFIMSRFVDPSDNKTFFYTAKYLRKDCFVPDGCNRPFLLCSNRGGGIGAPYLNRYATSFRRDKEIKPTFLNRFNGQVKDLRLNSFVLNKLLPSLSVTIPSKLKKAVRTFNVCMAKLYGESSNFMTFYEDYRKYKEFFGKYFYCPEIKRRELKDMPSESYSFALRKLLEAEVVVKRYYQKGKAYFDEALSLSRMREKYLVRLFEHAEDITSDHIMMRSYRYRVAAAAAAAREIL